MLKKMLLQIAKYGGAKIQGGKLFTTASPCELCSKSISVREKKNILIHVTHRIINKNIYFWLGEGKLK